MKARASAMARGTLTLQVRIRQDKSTGIKKLVRPIARNARGRVRRGSVVLLCSTEFSFVFCHTVCCPGVLGRKCL